MKIVLVVPHHKSMAQQHYSDIPQLGVGYLASHLLHAGIETHVVDAKMEGLDGHQVVEKLQELHPDMVGFSSMTHEITMCHDLAEATKEWNPKIVTVIGGCHVSALPQRTLEEFSSFDYGVLNEGEETLQELVSVLGKRGEVSDIKGLAFRGDGEIEITPARDSIKDLDTIPFPAWGLVPPTRVYPIMTSRGCPFNCNFCMRNLGSLVRLRSPENVVQELEMLVSKFNAKDIRFRDETFTANRKHVEEVLELLVRSGLHKKVVWSAMTHVNTIREDLLKRMKEAGCSGVSFGVESGNGEILKRMGKHISVKKAENAVAMAKKAGLETGSYFIFGHPYETLETIRDTQNLAVRLNTTTVNFGSMVPYPGTALYDMAVRGEGGYRIISYDWSDWDKYLGNAVEMEGLPRKLLEKEQMRAYILFYLKNWRLFDAFGFFWLHKSAIVMYCWRMIKSAFRRGQPASGQV